MTTAAAADTRDTLLVHRALRRELAALPTLVRRSAGDREGAARVRAHAEELLGLLHHHHAGQDALLWSRLVERVADAQPLVRRLAAQQDEVAVLVADVATGLAAWGGDPRHGEALTLVLQLLHDALAAHLDAQDRSVLPLVAATFTQAECDELGHRGVATVPRSRRPAVLGLVLADADDEERAAFLAHVPAPSRLAYLLVGRRQHARETAALRIPVQRRGRPRS